MRLFETFYSDFHTLWYFVFLFKEYFDLVWHFAVSNIFRNYPQDKTQRSWNVSKNDNLDYLESLTNIFFRFAIFKLNGNNHPPKMKNYPLNWESIVKPKKSWRQSCRISRRNTEKLSIYCTILKMNSKPLKNDLILVWVSTRSRECLSLLRIQLRRRRLKVNFWTFVEKLVKLFCWALFTLELFSSLDAKSWTITWKYTWSWHLWSDRLFEEAIFGAKIQVIENSNW